MIDMYDYTKRARVDGEYLVTGYNTSEKRMNRFIQASFCTGYVFGAYLSVGTTNIVTYNGSTRGIVFWYVEKGMENQLNRLKACIQEAFGVTLSVREQSKSSTYQVVCYSKPMATLLSSMGKRGGSKYLPGDFYFDDVGYKRGLVSGIQDFRGNVPDTRSSIKKRKLSIGVLDLYNRLTSIDTNV